MKLVVGLGNPGKKYRNNRHNVGYMVIEKLLEKGFSKNLVVKKTGVFMNESGKYVKNLIDRFKLDTPNLWVIHDDLDIALGNYKIQKGKGPKDHKGILSIEEKLGTNDFWRVRVGVENRSPEKRISGESYVLQNFSEEELDILHSVINNIIEGIHDRLASSN